MYFIVLLRAHSDPVLNQKANLDLTSLSKFKLKQLTKYTLHVHTCCVYKEVPQSPPPPPTATLTKIEVNSGRRGSDLCQHVQLCINQIIKYQCTMFF